MAPPITWQNIAAPQFGDALVGMNGARQSLRDSTDALTRIAEAYQANSQANWQQGVKNNTSDALAAILNAQKPEDMAAARADVVARLASANGQIDTTTVTSALDSRLGTLQQRDLAGIQYKTAQEQASTAAEYQRRLALAALGDKTALEGASTEFMGIRGGDLSARLVQGQHAVGQEQRAQAQDARAAELQPGNLQHQKDQSALTHAQIRNMRDEAANRRRQLEIMEQKARHDTEGGTGNSRLDTRARQYAEQNLGLFANDTATSDKGMKAIDASLKAAGVPDSEYGNVYSVIRKFPMVTITRNGQAVNIPVPANLVAELIRPNSKNLKEQERTMWWNGPSKPEALIKDMQERLQKDTDLQDRILRGFDAHTFLNGSSNVNSLGYIASLAPGANIQNRAGLTFEMNPDGKYPAGRVPNPAESSAPGTGGIADAKSLILAPVGDNPTPKNLPSSLVSAVDARKAAQEKSTATAEMAKRTHEREVKDVSLFVSKNLKNMTPEEAATIWQQYGTELSNKENPVMLPWHLSDLRNKAAQFKPKQAQPTQQQVNLDAARWNASLDATDPAKLFLRR